ncbi:hypothetical protein [Trinickia fusca]|uniref:DUF4148 domain-containing protein n=1 Tax=Trinickia fusca TaxID=2419777 RepID=A0A494XBG0_9BURK|nr:hypothetical protein [Trinickia fusca]RKP48167.1 hypothetical protein D7S89_12535 [Trinickia fusca]
MNHVIRFVAGVGFVLASAGVFATPKLTPQQCNDYPFVKPRGSPTHDQVVNEQVELQAFGYDSDEDPYPSNFEAARRRLWQAYAVDCKPSASSRPAAEAH